MADPRRLPQARAPAAARGARCRSALRDWKEVYEPFGREEAHRAGGAVHGLRHPLLPRGLPARQPDPGVERPRLPGRLVRGHRAPARHQQLPRVHRAALPGAVRGRVRARHQRRPGDHRAHRVRDRRAGLGRGLGDLAAPPVARPASRWRSWARGPAGLAAAQQLARAGHARRRLRAGRAPRRPAPLRHPRVQDGEGRAGPPPRPDGGRGRPSSACRVVGGHRRGPHPEVPVARPRPRRPWSRPRPGRRSSTPWCWPAGPPCPATCAVPGRELRGIHLAHGLPEAVQPGPGGRAAPRRRSPPRASTWSSSAAATPGPTAWARPTARVPLGPPARDHARAAEPARAADNPWPHLAADPAHLVGPRGGGRAPLLGDHDRVRRRRLGRRAGPARPRPSRSPPTTVARRSCRSRAPSSSSTCELVLLAMGFLGTERQRRWPSSASSSTPGATSSADRTWATNVDGVFVCGDMTRGQSLIVWAIAEGRSAAAAVDRYLIGRRGPLRPRRARSARSQVRERELS